MLAKYFRNKKMLHQDAAVRCDTVYLLCVYSAAAIKIKAGVGVTAVLSTGFPRVPFENSLLKGFPLMT